MDIGVLMAWKLNIQDLQGSNLESCHDLTRPGLLSV